MSRTSGTSDRQYVAAVDQGTTSTRCLIFDHRAEIVGSAQREHQQHFPRPGWVEHDPIELWENTCTVITEALRDAGVTAQQVTSLGVTNQRETVVVWERATGRPVHRAIVWQDTRTGEVCEMLGKLGGGADRYRDRTGLPLATYFSGPKIRWILDDVAGARDAADRGELLAGTVDSWLVWNLTGGAAGGVHVTDVTNASRTLLMDLATLKWDADIATDIGVPLGMLPEIRPSVGDFGRAAADGPLPNVRVLGVLGDQQAAMFGQARFAPGDAKNTYGTGSFVLMNTGTEPVRSKHGLITTLCYQIDDAPAVYALEGSIAVTGSLVQWLRDNLGLISTAPEIEGLAGSVSDTGGVYVVPAFSGLFAPHWSAAARGTVVGLTGYTTKAHLSRAVLEAAAFQTCDVLAAMTADSGHAMAELRVDGGMSVNDLFLQIQADVLGISVVRPRVTETTALGAAYAAGIGAGFWNGTEEVGRHWARDRTFEPVTTDEARSERLHWWHKAVGRSLDWAETTPQPMEGTP